MKRTPLVRRTPLQRMAIMRRRSKTKAYARRERDFPHMKKVRRLPCSVAIFQRLLAGGTTFPGLTLKVTSTVWTPCRGHVQVDHVGKRGMGQRSHDHETAAMCKGHHEERTGKVGGRGSFDGWTTLEMRAWCDWAVWHTWSEVLQMDKVA